MLTAVILQLLLVSLPYILLIADPGVSHLMPHIKSFDCH